MSSTSSTTSPNDVGSTGIEATDEDATRLFPAAKDTQPPTSPAIQPVVEPETQSVTMSLPASQGTGVGTASTGSTPASLASNPMWSTGTVTGQGHPQAPQDVKSSTLLRRVFLLLVGGLLIAAGLGPYFDFTTTVIACLTGLRALLAVAALVPKERRGTKKS